MKIKYRIRDIIIIVISMIIIVLGINIISQATTLSLNNYISKFKSNQPVNKLFGLGDLASHGGYGNVFCVQHGNKLNSEKLNYKLEDVITIKGNDAEDTRGNGKSGELTNGELAYILRDSIDSDNKEKLIWVKMEEWKNNVKDTIPNLEGYGISAGTGDNRVTSDTLSKKSKKVLTKATEYANAIENEKSTASVTKRNTNITIQKNVNGYQQDGYSIIGPIILDYTPDLSEIILKDQNDNQLNKYSTINEKSIPNYKFVEIDEKGGLTADLEPGDAKSMSTGETFYILIRDEYFTNVTTVKITANTQQAERGKIIADILFWKAPTDKPYQNLISFQTKEEAKETASTDFTVSATGNLTIEKVDKNNPNIKLGGVGFTLTNSFGKYVNENGEIVDAETIIYTDEYGYRKIDNIPIGTYTFTEKSNPCYGYEVDPNDITVNVQAGENSKTIKNEQKYVKISGKVWKEEESGKDSVVINNVLDGNDYILGEHTDDNNIWLDNIRVYLKKFERDSDRNRTGEVTTITDTTTKDGVYGFSDVEIAKLEDYFIEFEYNGLTYECVESGKGGLWENPNSSKAREEAIRDNVYNWTYPENDYNARKDFNEKFSTIENGGAANKGVAKDSTGNNKIGLDYTLNNHVAELNNRYDYYKEGWNITANTFKGLLNLESYYRYLRGDDGYNTDNHPVTQVDEIKYVNLGLYRREKTDLAVVKDLNNIIAKINDLDYTYPYHQRTDDGFDNSTKYSETYTSMGYTRAVYESDYEFEFNRGNKDKELQLYVTYEIKIKNQSTSLISQVNSVVDYFDSRYEVLGVGTSSIVDEYGEINSDIEYTFSSYNAEYNKLTITPNIKISNQSVKSIYVQLKLDRSVINKMAEEQSDQSDVLGILNNVAEIDSYSTFDSSGNVYGGIDEDSAPGNAVPGDKSTYEDDTDSAPPLTITRAEARKLTGTVFLDSTTGELKTGETRRGSDMYDEGDSRIFNVHVVLKEYDKDGIETGINYESTTNYEGNFEISGFIPGNYKLEYRWNNNSVNMDNGKPLNVQNYKGVVYEANRKVKNIDGKYLYWYNKNMPGTDKNNPDLRYSDAIDDWEMRKEIDEELKNVKYNSATTKTQMTSRTPTMGITIEYPDSTKITASTTGGINIEDRYEIEKVDFGIVERARQEIELTKRVKTLKLTLANGQVISDVEFEYDKNGKLTAKGEKNHMTFMGTNKKGDQNGRFIKLELDNELIQGAKLEVSYEILFKNKSELDYNSELFYKYGTPEYPNLIKIKPTAIIDYLDKDWSFEENKNQEGKWEVLTLGELKEKDKVAKTVYDKEETPDTEINDRIILYTEKLSEKDLDPGKENSVMLNVSKILTTTDEISLENETEVVELEKNGGAKIPSIPGNYVPGSGKLTDDADEAEEVIVTPSTGENLNYIIPITIGLLALITLGTGVILIKKKVIDSKE